MRTTHNRASYSWLIYPAIVAGAILIWLGMGTTIPDQVAYDTAEGVGYTNVKITERSYNVFGQCSKGEIIQFKVTGLNAAGAQKSFTVCAGLNRGGTARF